MEWRMVDEFISVLLRDQVPSSDNIGGDGGGPLLTTDTMEMMT